MGSFIATADTDSGCLINMRQFMSIAADTMLTLSILKRAPRVFLLIPEQAAHRFRDDAAHPFRLIVARHSD